MPLPGPSSPHVRTCRPRFLELVGPAIAIDAAGFVAGGVAGAAAVIAFCSLFPGLSMEMDRDPSRIVNGLYGAERVGQETYAWSSEHATLALPGLDRSTDWSCSVRVRAGRPHASLFPELVVSVDGVIAGTHQVANDYRDVEITIPRASAKSGATVA